MLSNDYKPPLLIFLATIGPQKSCSDHYTPSNQQCKFGYWSSHYETWCCPECDTGYSLVGHPPYTMPVQGPRCYGITYAPPTALSCCPAVCEKPYSYYPSHPGKGYYCSVSLKHGGLCCRIIFLAADPGRYELSEHTEG